MRAARALPLLAPAVTGCIPPGISHGPRVREGTFIGATLAEIPTDSDVEELTGVLSLRIGSQRRQAGRLGHQFTLLIPVPAITASLEDMERMEYQFLFGTTFTTGSR